MAPTGLVTGSMLPPDAWPGLASIENGVAGIIRDAPGATRWSTDSIEEWLSSGRNAYALDSVMPLEGVTAELAAVHPLMATAYNQAAVITADGFRLINVDFTFAAREWASTRGSALVTRITADQRDTLQHVITDGVGRGQSMAEVARRIKVVGVGLDARSTRALVNYMHGLEESGTPGRRIVELAGDYRQRLLTARARNIARTEVQTAINVGRLAAWDTARARGSLAADAVVEWISTEGRRTCDICGALDGQRRYLDTRMGLFPGGLEAPPAHPSCRCTVVIASIGSVDGGSDTGADARRAPGRQQQADLQDQLARPGKPPSMMPGGGRPAGTLKPSDAIHPAKASDAYGSAKWSPAQTKQLKQLLGHLDDLHGLGAQPDGAATVARWSKSKPGTTGYAKGQQGAKGWLDTIPNRRVNLIDEGELDLPLFTHEFGHLVDLDLRDFTGTPAEFWTKRGAQWGSNPTEIRWTGGSLTGDRIPAQFAPSSTHLDAARSFLEQAMSSYPAGSLDELAKLSAEFAEYFGRANEVWARAYSQWVCTRSPAADMVVDAAGTTLRDAFWMEERRQAALGAPMWSDEVFASTVQPALEALLRARGLLA